MEEKKQANTTQISAHLNSIEFFPPMVRQILTIAGAIGLVATLIGAIIFILMGVLGALGVTNNFETVANGALGFGKFALYFGLILLFAGNVFGLNFGIVTFVVGLIFFNIGTIIGLIMSVSGGSGEIAPIVESILKSVGGLGIFLILIGIINVVAYLAKKFLFSEEKAKKLTHIASDETDIRGVSAVPRCWEMSRCRPNVRKTCPNFIAKKNCWKRKSGCFCDKELAKYLIETSTNINAAAEMDDIQKIAIQQKEKAKMLNKKIDERKRPWKVQKKLCHSCPVYLEHQEFKYRRNTWLSFPFTIIVMAILLQWVRLGYGYVARFLDTKIKNIDSLPDNFNLTTSLEGSSFEYVVIFLVALLVFSYMVVLVDNIFLKWKL